MRAFGIGILLALLPLSSSAQSLDPVFGPGWNWNPEALYAGVAGLGGVSATTARGPQSLFLSPAALTFGSGLEVDASFANRPGIGIVLRDFLDKENLSLGIAVRRTFARNPRGSGLDGASTAFDVGDVSFKTDTLSVGLATRSNAGRWRVGISGQLVHLSATGVWQQVLSDSGGVRASEVLYNYRPTEGLRNWGFGTAASIIYDVLPVGHSSSQDMKATQLRIGAALQCPTLTHPQFRRGLLVIRSGEIIGSNSKMFEGHADAQQVFTRPLTVTMGADLRHAIGRMSLRAALQADWTDYEALVRGAEHNLEVTGSETDVFLDSRHSRGLRVGIEVDKAPFRGRVGCSWSRAHEITATNTPSESQAGWSWGLSYEVIALKKTLRLDSDSVGALQQVLISARFFL